VRGSRTFPLVEGPAEVYICRRCVVVYDQILIADERERLRFERTYYRHDGVARVAFVLDDDGAYRFCEEQLTRDRHGEPVWRSAVESEARYGTLTDALQAAATQVTWWSERNGA
jgi:hypothetical protein